MRPDGRLDIGRARLLGADELHQDRLLHVEGSCLLVILLRKVLSRAQRLPKVNVSGPLRVHFVVGLRQVVVRRDGLELWVAELNVELALGDHGQSLAAVAVHFLLQVRVIKQLVLRLERILVHLARVVFDEAIAWLSCARKSRLGRHNGLGIDFVGAEEIARLPSRGRGYHPVQLDPLPGHSRLTPCLMT